MTSWSLEGTLVHLPIWNRLVKQEVLSNRSLNIAIWDVLGIIRCPRNGSFFPWEVLPLNDPYEPICHLGFIASLRFDVLAVRESSVSHWLYPIADAGPPIFL